MTKYKIAHIKEQGQDMIIIPLDSRFGAKSSVVQNEIYEEFSERSASAGLRGKVVLIWKNGRNTKFIAPTPWINFFKSISYNDILRNINKELSW
jgi:hypothetical protein